MSLLILIIAALAGSTLSGVIGMGGGTILLAVMASLLAPGLVVPVHGIVMLVANGTRAFRLIRNVVWSVFLMYVPTLFVGAAIGIQLYRGSGLSWFKPLIGGFVLASLLWDRFKPKRLVLPRWCFAPAGLVGGLLTILVGATGPFLATFFLRDDMDRRQIVATKAGIQTVAHVVKIPAFLYVGFDYREQLGLILPLTACAVLGSLIGTALLTRVGEGPFRLIFRVVLGVLALRLLAGAIG